MDVFNRTFSRILYGSGFLFLLYRIITFWGDIQAVRYYDVEPVVYYYLYIAIEIGIVVMIFLIEKGYFDDDPSQEEIKQ